MTSLDASSTIMERLDVVAPEDAPVIFTAPHNVCLRRDGMPDHKPEDYTSFLAQKFAAVAGGGSLSWSKREIDRTKQHRLTAADRRPDPSNRDPNYLATAELDDSPWHATHRALFSRCLEVHLGQAASRPGAAPQPIMSFDIHGAAGKDIDVYLGLKAMACAAGSAATRPPCVPHLRACLSRELGASSRRGASWWRRAASTVCRAPGTSMTTTAAAAAAAAAAAETTTPALPLPLSTSTNGSSNEENETSRQHAGRVTVSQQATRIGFTIAAQVELSRRLRRALHGDPDFRRAFALALVRAGSGAMQAWKMSTLSSSGSSSSNTSSTSSSTVRSSSACSRTSPPYSSDCENIGNGDCRRDGVVAGAS